MVDRHHRLRALLEMDKTAETYGYVIDDVNTSDLSEVLRFLQKQGWLYLYNGRGIGPKNPELLPSSLLGMEDDPYRSLVWKLKKEGAIAPQPLIPYHEFKWGAWLRRRPLPPFNSKNLKPAINAAKRLAFSKGASHLPGWQGS